MIITVVLKVMQYLLVPILTSGLTTLALSLQHKRQLKRGRSTNTPPRKLFPIIRFWKCNERYNSSRRILCIISYVGMLVCVIPLITLMAVNKFNFDNAAALIEMVVFSLVGFVFLFTFLVSFNTDDCVGIKDGRLFCRAGEWGGILRFEEIRSAIYIEEKKAVTVYLHDGKEITFLCLLEPRALVERINHGVADGETATEL